MQMWQPDHGLPNEVAYLCNTWFEWSYDPENIHKTTAGVPEYPPSVPYIPEHHIPKPDHRPPWLVKASLLPDSWPVRSSGRTARLFFPDLYPMGNIPFLVAISSPDEICYCGHNAEFEPQRRD